MPCLGMNFDHAVATKNDLTHFSRHRRIWCWPMLLLAGLRVSHHVGALSWEVLKLSSKLLRLLVPTKQGWIQLIEPARMEGTSRKIGRLNQQVEIRCSKIFQDIDLDPKLWIYPMFEMCLKVAHFMAPRYKIKPSFGTRRDAVWH